MVALRGTHPDGKRGASSPTHRKAGTRSSCAQTGDEPGFPTVVLLKPSCQDASKYLPPLKPLFLLRPNGCRHLRCYRLATEIVSRYTGD